MNCNNELHRADLSLRRKQDSANQIICQYFWKHSSSTCSQNSVQTARLCLPFVLRDSRDNFFKSSEAAVPDAMSVSLDLPPQALPFLLLGPETFESSDDCFSLHGLSPRGFIGSNPLLALSLLEV